MTVQSIDRTLSRSRRKGLTLKSREAMFGYLFVAPQVIGFLLFVVGPVIAVILFSFENRNILTGVVTPAGLANYARMVDGDPLFSTVLVNSLIFTAGLVPLNLIFALVLAVLMNRP